MPSEGNYHVRVKYHILHNYINLCKLLHETVKDGERFKVLTMDEGESIMETLRPEASQSHFRLG